MYSWSYFLVYANERTCAVLRVNQIEKPYAINALIEKPYRINNAPYSRTLLEYTIVLGYKVSRVRYGSSTPLSRSCIFSLRETKTTDQASSRDATTQHRHNTKSATHVHQ